jgi:hypothetical protein
VFLLVSNHESLLESVELEHPSGKNYFRMNYADDQWPYTRRDRNADPGDAVDLRS